MRDATSLDEERFLVTGAYGCIGAWVLRELLERGATAIAADIAAGSHRLGLVLDDEHDERLRRVQLDITDLGALERAIDEHALTRVIHLAALQVPFCRADPPLGAAVNVIGTVNVLEAARRRQDRIAHVVYASSIAAYDALDGPGDVPASTSMKAVPGTLYGVFKRAGEHIATRYWLDDGLASIGLRPHTVFGPARDQGLTSAPTTAMLAAAAGRPYSIPYGGRAQFQYAPDVAKAFVQAALADVEGAAIHNLRGVDSTIAAIVDEIVEACPQAGGTIGYGETSLTFPPHVDSDGLEQAIGRIQQTPLPVAVRETIERFRMALADGRIDPAILESPTPSAAPS